MVISLTMITSYLRFGCKYGFFLIKFASVCAELRFVVNYGLICHILFCCFLAYYQGFVVHLLFCDEAGGVEGSAFSFVFSFKIGAYDFTFAC